jgi:hypothetical protein
LACAFIIETSMPCACAMCAIWRTPVTPDCPVQTFSTSTAWFAISGYTSRSVCRFSPLATLARTWRFTSARPW